MLCRWMTRFVAAVLLALTVPFASALAMDLPAFSDSPELHDPSRMLEVAPGVYRVFASSHPDWPHHLRSAVLDTNASDPRWRIEGIWPTGEPIPGFMDWSANWWREYGYDFDNQVGHLEVAAVAPTQLDANTVYFNLRNLPGWEFARENQIEPAMLMGLYRATATGDWPNQTWTMDPLPVYYSDGFTWEQGGPRGVDAQAWTDTDGQPYLTFGSWDPESRNVIVLAELDEATGRIEGFAPDEAGYYDPANPNLATLATFGEAAAILPHNGEYFLFLNLESCCSGVDSTYQIVVGRSDRSEGPYVDDRGRRFDVSYPETDANADLVQIERFAGRLVLAGQGRYIGPGHAGFLANGDGTYTMSFHYYDGRDGGVPKLATQRLAFDDEGWPVVQKRVIPEPAAGVVLGLLAGLASRRTGASHAGR